MAEPAVPNGHPQEQLKQNDITNATTEAQPKVSEPPKKRPPKRNKPNYQYIHRNPLPLEIYPLPAFHPTNPVSLLQIAYSYISQLLFPPSSHSSGPYIGYFSSETRSVHITNPAHVRALWEMGFFGKGTLSRSEPSWLEREAARREARKQGGGTAEEATRARREERRMFKLERARAERERIDRQRMIEEGKLVEGESGQDPETGGEGPDTPETKKNLADGAAEDAPAMRQGRVPDAQLIASAETNVAKIAITIDGEDGPLLANQDDILDEEPELENQEHLQLTLEEAFFLAYGLGVITIVSTPSDDDAPNDLSNEHKTNAETLTTFRCHSSFPPSPVSALAPDDQFLLNYVVYHHFRSLGWCVRPGIKFSVDYLLYNRGPVFSHAEFGVMIMPSYSDPYWSSEEGMARRRIREQKDWWWLHCVNRVQSQVKKSLVLCYVEVPAPMENGNDIGGLLRGYKVREFVIRRWLMNRSRG